MLKVLVNADQGLHRDLQLDGTGKDYRTYALSLAILHEEIEHEAWFSEFLGEGPSGHGGSRHEARHSP